MGVGGLGHRREDMADARWTRGDWLTAAGIVAVFTVPSVGWGCKVSADLAALRERVTGVERDLADNETELDEQDGRLDAVEREVARMGGGQ